MAETSEARKPVETGDRNQPEARDRGRLHSVADQAGQEARQSGEKSAEALRRTAEATADATRRTAEAAADATRRAADQGHDLAMSGLRAIAGVQRPLADAGLEQSRRLVETTAHVTDVYRQAAERADVDVRALFNSWTSVGRGLQDWQRAYFDLFQQSMGSIEDKRRHLAKCNSPVEFAEVQRDLYVELVRNTLTANARLWQLVGQIAQQAVQPLQHRAQT